MILNSLENIEKAQKKVEKLNAKFVSNFKENAAQRHVKEQNEPVLDQISNNFQLSYANEVVGKSMKEIVKELKNV